MQATVANSGAGLNLAQRKQALMELKKLQDELRAAVESKIPAGKKITDAARIFGIGWADISRFLTDGRPACSGRMLHGLAENSGRRDLIAQIEQVAEGLPDWMRGVSSFPDQVIELFFQLHERVEQSGDGVAKFARARSEMAKLIQQVFFGNRQALSRLNDPKTAEKFRTAVQADGKSALTRSVAEFREIIRQLRPYFETKGEIADAIGVRREFLKTDSDRNLVPVLEAARKLLASKRGEKIVSPPKTNEPKEAMKIATGMSGRDAESMMNNAISVLNSITNLVEGLACGNEGVRIDGNRMHAVRIAKRLLAAFSIDGQVLKKLEQVEALAPGDSSLLGELFRSARSTDKKRR